MATRIALCHRTTYTYDRLVTLSPHVIRLRPAPHCRTRILSYSIRIEPEEHFFNLNQDPFSNYEARVVFNEPARKFEVVVDLTAEMIAINPFDFFLEGYAETFPFNYPAELLRELKPYLEPSEGGRLLKNLFVSEWPREAVRTNDLLVHLNQHVQKLVSYAIRLEPGVQSCEETLGRGIGSCRDSAYLLVQLLRHMGLAARFVSGYLVQLVPDEKPLEGPAGLRRISRISTRGPRFSCRARDGSAWTRPPACLRPRGIFRWPARRSPRARRRSPGRWTSARRSSVTRTACGGFGRIRG